LFGKRRRGVDRAVSAVRIVGSDKDAFHASHDPFRGRRSCFKLMM
jgi:hypothetical protein